jgi:dipeptidyl aminopeptidase/acylaminoacyl peptidase
MNSSKRATFACIVSLAVPFLFTSLKFHANTRRPAKKRAPVSETVQALGKIAFASDRDGNFEIYLMDTDGGGQTRLTESPGEDYSPAWSPDGTRLVFVSTRDGNAEIYTMNRDGTGQTRLTNNSAGDITPAWSPDGSQIAFVSNREGNDDIFLMNVDGANQTNITVNPADDNSPAFSPGGESIAFSSNRFEGQFDIYVMNATRIAVTRLTIADGTDITPGWSGQQITFQSDRDDNNEIYKMESNGTNQTRLTNHPEIDVDPAQSTDGSKIAFSSSRDGNLEVYLMNPDGTGLVRLTNNNAADIEPAIQPNGVINPPPPQGASTIQFSSSDYTAGEAQPSATLFVTRNNTSDGASVDFATVNGSATNRTDYTYNFGTLRFAPGEATKNIMVLLTDDVFIEPDETFTVTLSHPTGAVLGSLNTATLTILDNDTARPRTNPIDDARYFVNQHYLDFLNRAPDPEGLQYWTDQITGCGNNPVCLISRRNGVSAAFFAESEFQVTGFFVYRLHKGSFGVLPLRQQFIMDRSRVHVGSTLEADKAALADDFVMREPFLIRYPLTQTPEEFVNKLFDTANLFPFTAERERLAQEMRNGKTRSQVLREVIEIQQFKNAEFNPAFVLMQYFGYLGRDPDPGGYAFWLDILNNRQPNNFLGMVCAFITSTEYQERFSSVVTLTNSSCAVP